MRVLVLGGDGFVGWPAALHLSAAGHDVTIADDFARRGADAELQAGSVTPIRSLNDRVAAWRELGGSAIGVHTLDVAQDHEELRDRLAADRPHAVVHLAQQRAAPYSMRTATHKRYTVDNNVSATHNLLAALVETGVDAHVLTLGAPAGTGASVQRVTQTMNRALLDFYAANDGVRATELQQGVVWGTQTRETARDEGLVNRFDYDGDYGTLLNRFLVQAAVGHPLEVHGAGGRSRSLVHLRDAVAGIADALAYAPGHGEPVRVLDRTTVPHRVGDLARLVATLTGAEIAHPEDPRREPEAAVADEPPALPDDRLLEVVELARRYRDRIDGRRIPCTSRWVRDATDAPAPAVATA